jgi:hypothetical protein
VKELDSYLNDHLAGSVGALELIAHCAHLYEGKSLGLFFAEMEAQIGADQATLRDLMRRLGVEESKARQAGAWAGEKLGRALFTLAGNARAAARTRRADHGSRREEASLACTIRGESAET